MTKELSSLTGDLKQISECSLYRDPRISERARFHTFCRECKESATINQKSCPLCRPFLHIPDDGCGSIPKDYVKESLVDLHQLYLEKNLNLKEEKAIDIPLIEEFNVSKMRHTFAYMAWLENKIYILYCDSTTVRVFTDQAPFDELLEAIQIPALGTTLSMIANAVSRCIFISDNFGYIYKIQMPNRRTSRWSIRSLDGKSGTITRMSNSTVQENCLATSFISDECTFDTIRYDLQLFSRLGRNLHIDSAIRLPTEVKYVGHVVHSSKDLFVISHSNTSPATQCWISILSCDGKMIRTFEPELGSVLKNLGGCTFGIDNDGYIFVSDFAGNNVVWLNFNLTDYRILFQKDHAIQSPCNIVYIPEKRKLLVQERKEVGPVEFRYCISLFHLSPCNLIPKLK